MPTAAATLGCRGRARNATNYYAAFVRDPDGNKIEVVTFQAERGHSLHSLPKTG